MNILIAPDKFKGSLSAIEVCHALTLGLKEINPKFDVRHLPLADGGEGSLDIIKEKLNVSERKCTSIDPLGRSIDCHYFFNETTKEAYIELATSSGLLLLQKSERNPMKTSTVGTGMLIKDAFQKGAQSIFLFLGGSSTNDGGMGIAHALGIRFLDESGMVLRPTGEHMHRIRSIKSDQRVSLQGIKITLLCDVENTMLGEQGASMTFAQQKGASDKEIVLMEAGMSNLSKHIKMAFGKDISDIVGGGAAGGVGAGLYGMLNGEIKKGFHFIADRIDLEKSIAWADVVISGEGKLDTSSFQGKVVGELAELCKVKETDLHLVVGQNALKENHFMPSQKIKSVLDLTDDEDKAIQGASTYLMQIGRKLGHSFMI